MIWIVIYLLVGIVVLVALTLRNLPHDVCVSDLVAVPFVIAGWPLVLVRVAASCHIMERRLFTIGSDHDDGD